MCEYVDKSLFLGENLPILKKCQKKIPELVEKIKGEKKFQNAKPSSLRSALVFRPPLAAMRRGAVLLVVMLAAPFGVSLMSCDAAAVDSLRGFRATLDGASRHFVRDVREGLEYSSKGAESKSASLDEASFAALVAAFSGGEAAEAARVAAGADAAPVSSPIPFKLTNCDPAAAIQASDPSTASDADVSSLSSVFSPHSRANFPKGFFFRHCPPHPLR